MSTAGLSTMDAPVAGLGERLCCFGQGGGGKSINLRETQSKESVGMHERQRGIKGKLWTPVEKESMADIFQAHAAKA